MPTKKGASTLHHLYAVHSVYDAIHRQRAQHTDVADKAEYSECRRCDDSPHFHRSKCVKTKETIAIVAVKYENYSVISCIVKASYEL